MPADNKDDWLAQKAKEGAVVSNETLQKADDPVAELKAMGDRIAVAVPYEWLWPPDLKPFTNPTHKRTYDADLLAEHLEDAGYKSHIIRVVQWQNWAWLTAEAVRILNAKERRQRERAAKFGTGVPVRDKEAVAEVVAGESGASEGAGTEADGEVVADDDARDSGAGVGK